MIITLCAIAIAGALLAFSAWVTTSRMKAWQRQRDVELAEQIAKIKSAPAGARGYIFRKP
jgi:hypothetical protein